MWFGKVTQTRGMSTIQAFRVLSPHFHTISQRFKYVRVSNKCRSLKGLLLEKNKLTPRLPNATMAKSHEGPPILTIEVMTQVSHQPQHRR